MRSCLNLSDISVSCAFWAVQSAAEKRRYIILPTSSWGSAAGLRMLRNIGRRNAFKKRKQLTRLKLPKAPKRNRCEMSISCSIGSWLQNAWSSSAPVLPMCKRHIGLRLARLKSSHVTASSLQPLCCMKLSVNSSIHFSRHFCWGASLANPWFFRFEGHWKKRY